MWHTIRQKWFYPQDALPSTMQSKYIGIYPWCKDIFEEVVRRVFQPIFGSNARLRKSFRKVYSCILVVNMFSNDLLLKRAKRGANMSYFRMKLNSIKHCVGIHNVINRRVHN